MLLWSYFEMLWGCWHGVLSQETKACCCSQGNRMTLLRTKRDKNKAKIMLLGLGTFATRPFQHIISCWNPHKAPYHLPTPACLPTFYCVTIKAHPSAHPWWGLYFKCSWQPRASEQCGWFCQSKTCQMHGGQMPKSAGHALGRRGEDDEAQERKRHREKA